MQTNIGPSALGLQHMAARAQEVRKSPSQLTDATTGGIASDGNNVTPSGENLPASTSTPGQNAILGLRQAIEALQSNAAKSPEAKGLQQALERLQQNAEKSNGIDTQA